MTKLSKAQVARRAAKREADANSRASVTLAAAFNRSYCADDAEDIVLDSKGRRVRTSDATNEDVRALLIGNRVVDTEDILEAVGEKQFANMVNNGALVRDASFSRYKSNNMYWVTEKAVDLYGLPKTITLAGGATVGYRAA